MNILKKVRYLLPLIIFLPVVILLWRGLSLHPAHVPSPLVNKPAPAFELPLLAYPDKLTNNKLFLGRITLLNVWASWCYACAEEHQFLLELAKKEYLTLYGFNYKDNPVDAKKWLAQMGNPFKLVAVDQVGSAAIDWGIYGAPETFLIDKKGIIRYKFIGTLTADVWQKNFEPLVDEIRKEKA